MRHEFYQRSVVPWEELATTAMEHSMGTALPDDLLREFLRQGVIMRMKDGRLQCTSEALQREEDGIVGFAAGGQGAVRPIGQDNGLGRVLSNGVVLNDGQWQAVTGLLNSPNRVNMIQGPAGAGKSAMLAAFDEGVRRAGQHVTYLATTATAVGVLEKDGFEANTLARFLLDKDMQAEAQGGRVVIDETSMLGHKDAVKLFEIAQRDDLKLIFVGDPMQHGSVPRGAFMRLLNEYARGETLPAAGDHAAGNAGVPGGGAVALRGENAGRLRRARPPGLGQGAGRRPTLRGDRGGLSAGGE